MTVSQQGETAMLQEIPPDEQLLVSAVPLVPPELRFVFQGSIWPDDRTLKNPASRPPGASSELRDDTLAWIETALKPEWLAPDLPTRLRTITAANGGQDAFIARYAVDGNRIQIIVNRVFMHFVISPASGSLFAGAPGVTREFLRVDLPDEDRPWTGEPWSIIAVDGFTFGYHPSAEVQGWRDSLDYLTNGRAVKFSANKVAMRPPGDRHTNKTESAPTEESVKHWFQ
jgi:hypothetical protein